MDLDVVLLVVLLGAQLVAVTTGPNNDCHIYVSQFNRTTSRPSIASGINYTMWQEFKVCGVHIQSYSVKWKREPYSLSNDYETSDSNHTEDNCTVIDTFLTILNTSVNPDEGLYTVHIEVYDGCGNYSEFHLTIPDCDKKDPPEPSIGNKTVILAEPQDNQKWCVSITFHGFNDKTDYNIEWLLEGVDLCSHRRDKYTCTRKTFGQCTLTSNFCILNYTHADSHNYVTKATPVSEGSPTGRNTTVYLKVLQLPAITGPKSYLTHVVPASLFYDVANYSSPYVTITCKKNGHIHHPCHPEPDNTRAKVTLDIPQNEAGHYEVCANFSEEVNTQGTTFQAQCRQTNVSPEYFGAEIASILLVFVIPAVVITICIIRRASRERIRRHRRRDTTDDAEGNERVPLFVDDSESDDDITETDAPVNSSHRTNQRQRLSSLPNRRRRPRIPPPPNPQHYEHPVYGVIPKVCIIYAHNPGEYTRIEPVYSGEILQNESEIHKHEVEQKKRIRQHEQLIYKFATFLQHSGVAVAYDQLLYDSIVSNRKKWFEEQISDSDYIILIITPSFRRFLKAALPDEEYMFAGDYLYNIIDCGNLKFLLIFLNAFVDTDLLPPTLHHTQSFEIREPFDVQFNSREDGLVKLYRLLTNQTSKDNMVQQPPHIVHLPEDGVNPGGVVEDRPVSDADILMLSQNPSFSKHWKPIATTLGTEQREKGDQDESCYQMLKTWRYNAEPGQATLRNLAEAVRDIDDLCKIVRQRLS